MKKDLGAYFDEVAQDDVPVRLDHGERDEEDELRAVVVGPKDFPQPQHVFEPELALERDEHPSETEEQVQAVYFL